MSSNTRPRASPTKNILLAVTGSVAAIKSPEIAVKLVSNNNYNVKVLLTAGGKNFWTKAEGYNREYWNLLQEEIRKETISIIHSDDEWKGWNELGDPVLHIDLRDWADLLLIAPLSAHTLAKLANGLCDDTASCVVRAWDFGHGVRPGKPLLLAPAMNTAMWNHPLTQQQLSTIQSFWNTSTRNRIRVIDPVEKTLACGEVGTGALASVETILAAIEDH